MLVFLDTKSTLSLAIAHPFAREVLKNQVTWRKLLKRSISEDCFNQQDKSNIQHLTEILRSLRYALKKKRYFLGIFPNMGGGSPESQNLFYVNYSPKNPLKHLNIT